MLSKSQVDCLAEHFDFSGKRVLVIGRLSSGAFDELVRRNAVVNHLNPDVVVYWEVLSRVQAEAHLEFAAQKCTSVIVETDVLDTCQNMCTKNSRIKPSALYMESMLRRLGLEPEMVVDKALNKGGVTYDWPVKETWQCHPCKRRVWIANRV
jgi:hypothetical protein